MYFFFFFSSRRRHTRLQGDWSSDVCSSDLFHGSALEAGRLLEADVPLVAVDGYHEREADRGLGGGDRYGEDHEDDAGRGGGGGAVAPERDEVQVGRVEHQLYAQQNQDAVAARERAGQPDGEQ